MAAATIKTFCTTREAAMLLGVSVGTVQLWVESGLLKAWKTSGGHRRVMRDSVSALLQNKPEVASNQAFVREYPMPMPMAAVVPAMRRLSVLVVEEDPELIHVYDTAIKKWPWSPDLTLAANGLTALLKMGRQSPDLLITELNLSQLDGFEMLRAIRSTPWLDTTAIVVVSALDAAQIAVRGGLPPNIKVLPKPVPLEQLMAIAKELVNERRLERRVVG